MLPSGTEIGPYVIEHRIAASATAEVYQARHQALGKLAAIKVMRHGLTDRSDLKKRFLREGELATRVAHPSVVDVRDVGFHNELPYLVMEYLEGENLAELLETEGQLDVEAVANIMLPIMAAVAAGHDQGIVHRDLKPANIFLARVGRGRVQPKLLDFGVSRMTDLDGTDKRTLADAGMLGTPQYLSPEQAKGHSANPPSDQYSLGVILYEAVTGSLPRDSDSVLDLINRIAREPVDPPSTRWPEIPPELESIIVRSLAQRPDDRFPSVRTMAEALLPFASPSVSDYWRADLEASGSDERESGSDSDIDIDVSSSMETHTDGVPLLDRSGHVRDSLSPSDRPAADDVSTRPDLPPAGMVPDSRASSTPVPESTGSPGRSVRATPADAAADDPSTQRSKKALWLAAAVAVVLLLGLGIWQWRSDEQPPTVAAPASSPLQVTVRTVPKDAVIELDGKRMGRGHIDTTVSVGEKRHRLTVRAPGYESQTITFSDAAPPQEIQLVKLPSKGAGEAAAGAGEVTERARTTGDTPAVRDTQLGEASPRAAGQVSRQRQRAARRRQRALRARRAREARAAQARAAQARRGDKDADEAEDATKPSPDEQAGEPAQASADAADEPSEDAGEEDWARPGFQTDNRDPWE
jgi:serine/threonine-protein kinase